jgi:hypothetical protein
MAHTGFEVRQNAGISKQKIHAKLSNISLIAPQNRAIFEIIPFYIN